MLVSLWKWDGLVVVLCSPCVTAGGSTSEWVVDCVVVRLFVQPRDTAGNNVAVSVWGTGLETILWPTDEVAALLLHPVEDNTENRDTSDDNTEEVDGADEYIDKDNDGDETVDDETDGAFLFPSIKDTCDGLETADAMVTGRGGVGCWWDMLEVRPELAAWVLPPADDDEEDISEPWLEICEGHSVVWVSSLVIVGEVLLWSRLIGCLTVPAMTVKTEEKAGCPDKPSPSDSASPSEWTTEKGTSSATDRSANGWTGAAVTAGSLCKDEEPEAS